MIVFASMRSSDSATYVEHRDAISHDWARWFDASGITPILVPNALRKPEQLLHQLPGAALLLTGGDDIGDTDTPRDRTERELLRAALARCLPVLGTCRGLHMINNFFGGTLARGGGKAHVATEHEVKIVDELGGLLQTGTFRVNSYHRDCVLSDGLAGELRAFALADRVVEGLYHPLLPITAVQWHPERDNPGAALDAALVQRWLSKCV